MLSSDYLPEAQSTLSAHAGKAFFKVVSLYAQPIPNRLGVGSSRQAGRREKRTTTAIHTLGPVILSSKSVPESTDVVYSKDMSGLQAAERRPVRQLF